MSAHDLPAWAGGDGAGRGEALSPQGDDPDRRHYREGVAVFRGLIAALIASASIYVAVVTVAAIWLVVTQ